MLPPILALRGIVVPLLIMVPMKGYKNRGLLDGSGGIVVSSFIG